MRLPPICYLLLLWLSFTQFASAQQTDEPILSIQPNENYHSIGKFIQFYEDESNNLKLADVLKKEVQQQFKRSKAQVPGFGIEDVTIWVKIDLENTGREQINDYLEISFPTLDSVFYFYKDYERNRWNKLFASDRVPFDQRVVNHKNIVFPLAIDATQKTTIYLRVRNKGSIILPINIMPQSELFSSDIATEMAFGIFYGIMLVMFLYNLLLAFTARSITYIFYVGIIAGNLFTLSALNGHAFQYLWYDNPWWANHVIIFGIGLWILSGNLFASSFLDAKHGRNWNFRAFQIMQFFGIAVIVAAFTLDYKISLIYANYGLIFNCIFLFASGIIFWVRGIKVASFFTLAWALYLIGVLLYTLRNLGILPVNIVTSHVLEIGAVSEVVLLSVSLGFKYRLLELDKKRAQQNSLDLMTRSQEIIQQQNEQLEKRIQERTAELSQKQEEVITQNEKLNEQNAKLREAQELIQQQNKQLQAYNDDLENKVAKRTEDLKSTNQELAQNVQKLEQYAYMTAHNLRAPVARLLGLTQLIEIDPTANLEEEWLHIISKIKEEGHSLDAVINDLNAILELRQASDDDLEKVDLNKKTQQVFRILKNTIEKNDVQIVCDFQEFVELKSNPTFIESMLYNLISNAIKYKRPEVKPIITLKTSYKAGHKVISVSDNGIGIDLSKFKSDLFGMYKRFHTHVDGKGLGLFLVKSQLEILGGKIKVESELNKGTNFHLIFPAGV